MDLQRKCLHCNKENVKNKCGGCWIVYVCDRKCQILSWPKHREICLKTPKEMIMSHKIEHIHLRNENIEKKKANVVKSFDEINVLKSLQSNIKLKKENEIRRLKRNIFAEIQNGCKLIRNTEKEIKKTVTWGHVYAREFYRSLGGGSVVPHDGTWALGLGEIKIKNHRLGTIENYEIKKNNILNGRFNKLSKREKNVVKIGETRQFDYCKSKIKNPLFHRLNEKERKNIFMYIENIPNCIEKGRKNADSFNENIDYLALKQGMEFTFIRESRRNSAGCNCGPTHLLNKLNKLKNNIKNIHQFIIEYKLLDENYVDMNKHELLDVLRNKIKTKRCNTKDINGNIHCQCLLNGIGCHSDVCEGCNDICCKVDIFSYIYDSNYVKEYKRKIILNINKNIANPAA